MVKYDLYVRQARQGWERYWGVGLRRRSVQGLSKTSGAATCKLCSSEHSRHQFVSFGQGPWPGLVWFGLVWSGLAWFGFDRNRIGWGKTRNTDGYVGGP